MKVTGIRELRSSTASLLGGDEPLLVTRHGKISGLYVPLEHPDRLPEEMHRELARVIGQHLSGLLETKGVTEAHVQEDFDAHRRRRR